MAQPKIPKSRNQSAVHGTRPRKSWKDKLHKGGKGKDIKRPQTKKTGRSLKKRERYPWQRSQEILWRAAADHFGSSITT